MVPTNVALLTAGDPNWMTGGHLFHRRMADLAGRHGAQVRFVAIPSLPVAYGVLAGPWWLRSPEIQTADVVVLDSIAAAPAAPWLRWVRSPILAMLHQPPGGIGTARLARLVRTPLDRWAYRRCRLLMVASEWLAFQLIGDGLDARRLRVVTPGKDPAPAGIVDRGSPDDAPSNHAERRAALRAGRRTAALCVASWLAPKGILELLDALARLPDDRVTLHLVGDPKADPTYAGRVRARLASPRLRGRVVVHGVRSPATVAALYRAVDLFVLPSFQETYGTVWGEAMAAGLPIIGWRAANLPFLADHDREALLAPPGDVSMLAAHMERLALEPGTRERLGRAGARRAHARPTWEETAQLFFATIEEARRARR